MDREGTPLWFRVGAASYETRRLLLPTTRKCSRWGTVFTDDPMTAARIDGVAHHGHRLIFEGERCRLSHALMTRRN
jgi:DNA replication protein DnaC